METLTNILYRSSLFLIGFGFTMILLQVSLGSTLLIPAGLIALYIGVPLALMSLSHSINNLRQQVNNKD